MRNFSIDYNIKEYKDEEGNTKYNVEIYDCRSTENDKKIDISVSENLEIIKKLLSMNSVTIHNRFVSDLMHSTPNIDIKETHKQDISDDIHKIISNIKQKDLDNTINLELNTFTNIVNDIVKSAIIALINNYDENYLGAVIVPIMDNNNYMDNDQNSKLRLGLQTGDIFMDLTSDNIDPLPLSDVSLDLLDNALYYLVNIAESELKRQNPDKDFIQTCGEIIKDIKNNTNQIINGYLQEYKNML